METIVLKNILKETVSNLNNEEVLTVHIIPHILGDYWGQSKIVFWGDDREVKIDNNKIIILKNNNDGEYVALDLGDEGYSKIQRSVRGNKLIKGTYKECFELIHKDCSVFFIITI